MQPVDVDAAEAVWDLAYATMRATQHLPAEPRTAELATMGRRRIGYLLSTDPGGAWIALAGDGVVGMAQAQTRGSRWVLSNLGVHPDHQDRGIGRMLLDRTLGYGTRSRSGAIFASPDPRAVHRYVRAGFDLHPALAASGPVRRALDRPPGVVAATTEGLGLVDEVDRVVRGDTRRRDIEFQLTAGCGLLVDGDGGYALVRDGRIGTLAAVDDAVAERLLRAHIAGRGSGSMVDVGWIRAKDQWAVPVLAEAGVELRVHGAVMLRGPWEMAGSYLPHGVFG